EVGVERAGAHVDVAQRDHVEADRDGELLGQHVRIVVGRRRSDGQREYGRHDRECDEDATSDHRPSTFRTLSAVVTSGTNALAIIAIMVLPPTESTSRWNAEARRSPLCALTRALSRATSAAGS